MVFSCRDLVTHLEDGEDAATGWAAHPSARLHLSVCRNCYRYLKQMRAVQAALAAVDPAPRPVSPETKERLAERFRAWRSANQLKPKDS